MQTQPGLLFFWKILSPILPLVPSVVGCGRCPMWGSQNSIGLTSVMAGIGCGHTQWGYTGSKILNKLLLLLKEFWFKQISLPIFCPTFFFFWSPIFIKKKKIGHLFFVPIFRPFFFFLPNFGISLVIHGVDWANL